MMAADGLTDELERIAADEPHGARALERIAFLAPHLERHFRRAHVVQREGAIEEPDERPDRARGVVVLRLAEKERAAAFDVAQVDVVAECGPDGAPGRIAYEHDLGLGVVPLGVRAHADPVAPGDGRQHWTLGEDLGIGSYGYLQVLRPE